MSTNSSQRWAVWYAVEGDVRFCSHHETLRIWERAAARATLPVRFTQGFNPRPRLSLALPRPVGVASRCELLIVDLCGEAMEPGWEEILAAQLPTGLRVLRVEPLARGRAPRVKAVAYEMPLEGAEAETVQARLAELAGMEKWQVLRRAPKQPDRPTELKGRLAEVGVEAGRLSFTLTGEQGGPAAVLTLLGLAGPGPEGPPPGGLAEAMSRLTRTKLQCEM